MHDAQKQQIVTALCHEVWQNYSIAFPLLHQIRPAMPVLDIGAKGNRYAGYCSYAGILHINTAYFDQSPDQMRETVAHELAHWICWKMFPKAKQVHGPEFKYVMQSIGYDGATYHRMSASAAKKVAKDSKDELFPL